MRSSSRVLLIACIAFAGCQSPQKEPAPEPAKPPTIEDFVRAVHIHGVPYDKARAFAKDKTVVPKLLAMLEDPAQEQAWANVVVTLCIIADESAVDPILAFITSGQEGKLPPARYAAKSSAVMALGYIVNKTGNKKCLDYLVSSVRPGAWEKRGVRWASPFDSSRAARDNDLNTKAVLGLALAGTPEASQALRELKKPAQDPDTRLVRSAVGPVVDTALAEHDKVAKMGLSAYYKQAHSRK